MLTDLQRYETKSRTLETADLLRDGAHVNSIGQVVLTGVQVDRARETSDARPAYMYTSFEERVESDNLDTDIGDVWAMTYPGTTLRVPRLLKAEHLHSLRHLLTIGSVGVSRINGCARTTATFTHIEGLMCTYLPQVVWKPVPSIADVAHYCDDLDQVPVAVLGRGIICELPNPSLGRMLALTPEQRATGVVRLRTSGGQYTLADRLVETYETGEAWARDFEFIKRHQGQGA